MPFAGFNLCLSRSNNRTHISIQLIYAAKIGIIHQITKFSAAILYQYFKDRIVFRGIASKIAFLFVAKRGIAPLLHLILCYLRFTSYIFPLTSYISYLLSVISYLIEAFSFFAILPIALSLPFLSLHTIVASHVRQYRSFAVMGAMGFVHSRSVGWWRTSVAICLRKMYEA